MAERPDSVSCGLAPQSPAPCKQRPVVRWRFGPRTPAFNCADAKSGVVGDLSYFAQISSVRISERHIVRVRPQKGRIGKMGREHHAKHPRRQYVSSVCALIDQERKIG